MRWRHTARILSWPLAVNETARSCTGRLARGRQASQARRHAADVAGVAAAAQFGEPRLDLVDRDVAEAQRDLLRAAELEAGAALDRGHELGSFEQRVHRAHVEPGIAAAHALDVQRAGLEVAAVEVGDLQLTAR